MKMNTKDKIQDTIVDMEYIFLNFKNQFLIYCPIHVQILV